MPCDGRDTVVTIDANPASSNDRKVVGTVAVPVAPGEAHHMGFTDDRRYLRAGGLADSRLHDFDVGVNPAKPKLVKTIADFTKQTGCRFPFNLSLSILQLALTIPSS